MGERSPLANRELRLAIGADLRTLRSNLRLVEFLKKLIAKRRARLPTAESRTGAVGPLALPNQLEELIRAGRWKTPSDLVLERLFPGTCVCVRFLETRDDITGESLELLADHLNTARIFKVYRGSRDRESPLPWLDVEKSVVLAVSENSEIDFAIALDYRETSISPSVVYSDWWTEPGVCNWVRAFDSFSSFAKAMYSD